MMKLDVIAARKGYRVMRIPGDVLVVTPWTMILGYPVWCRLPW